jgi:hypothetical protein
MEMAGISICAEGMAQIQFPFKLCLRSSYQFGNRPNTICSLIVYITFTRQTEHMLLFLFCSDKTEAYQGKVIDQGHTSK